MIEMNTIDRLKDESVYTCGSELFVPDHSLAESVVVRVGITCQMETQYYGTTTVHFPESCYHCGEVEPDMILNDQYIQELKQQFAVVWSLCKVCHDAGKEAKTRAPNNVHAAKKESSNDEHA